MADLLCCMRVSMMPEPPVLSFVMECVNCHRQVWVSEANMADDHDVEIWCLPCVMERSGDTKGEGLVTVRSREALHEIGMSDADIDATLALANRVLGLKPPTQPTTERDNP